MVRQRLQEGAFVRAGVRRTPPGWFSFGPSVAEFRAEKCRRKASETAPRAPQLGFINPGHLDVRMKPFKTQIVQVESNRVTASPNI